MTPTKKYSYRHRGQADRDWLGRTLPLSFFFFFLSTWLLEPNMTRHYINHVNLSRDFYSYTWWDLYFFFRVIVSHARRQWTKTHLGSILSKSASVFFFSSINCPVLSTTSSSKLSAYFSIMYTMLSKMFVFLSSEQQQKRDTLWYCKKTRLLSQKSCTWLLQRRRSMSEI